MLGVSYVNGRSATLWSTTAQVREATATLAFGDRLEILDRDGNFAEVRTAAGPRDGVDMRSPVRSEEWDQAMALLAKAKQMPIEASGAYQGGGQSAHRAQTASGPGASALSRCSGGNAGAAGGRRSGGEERRDDAEENDDAEPRKEDWWLVRATPQGQGEIAGGCWGRFLEVDLLVAAAGLRERGRNSPGRVAFVLGQLPDSTGGVVPEYLVLGTHGTEGLDCDFTVLRVYTPLSKRPGYGTAFVGEQCVRPPSRESDRGHRSRRRGAVSNFARRDGRGSPTYRSQIRGARRPACTG